MPRRLKNAELEGAVRLRRLEITNFKALDHLELDLPAPRMSKDPDVFVLGSRNGLGKTSVLEASALLLLIARLPPDLRKEFFHFRRAPEQRFQRYIDLSDLFVRSGSKEAVIEASVELDGKAIPITLTVARDGRLKLVPDDPLPPVNRLRDGYPPSWDIEGMVDSLASISPEPLVAPPLLYFHSYRKVSEGAPEFGAWIERGPRPGRWRAPGESAISSFKLEILSMMMRRADLFETAVDGREDSSEALDQLNEIIGKYAYGRIEKLLPGPDNTIDFRIMPSGGGRSFSFDGLSSGQKEVISTLFLVWRNTRRSPAIILIDEPELHLNPEWQRDFVKQIQNLTPTSQIIIATHSEDIWSSVPEDRRILLGD
jgi:hypothetical protein